MDVGEECFEGREKNSKSKEIVEVVKMKDRDKEVISEWDEKFKKSEDDKEREEDVESDEFAESEKECECENEDSSCRLHDG